MLLHYWFVSFHGINIVSLHEKKIIPREMYCNNIWSFSQNTIVEILLAVFNKFIFIIHTWKNYMVNQCYITIYHHGTSVLPSGNANELLYQRPSQGEWITDNILVFLEIPKRLLWNFEKYKNKLFLYTEMSN